MLHSFDLNKEQSQASHAATYSIQDPILNKLCALIKEALNHGNLLDAFHKISNAKDYIKLNKEKITPNDERSYLYLAIRALMKKESLFKAEKKQEIKINIIKFFDYSSTLPESEPMTSQERELIARLLTLKCNFFYHSGKAVRLEKTLTEFKQFLDEPKDEILFHDLLNQVGYSLYFSYFALLKHDFRHAISHIEEAVTTSKDLSLPSESIKLHNLRLTTHLAFLWHDICSSEEFYSYWKENINELFDSFWVTLFDQRKTQLSTLNRLSADEPLSLEMTNDLSLLYKLIFSKVLIYKFTDNTEDAHHHSFNYIIKQIQDLPFENNIKHPLLLAWKNFYKNNIDTNSPDLTFGSTQFKNIQPPQTYSSTLMELTKDFPVMTPKNKFKV